MNDNKITITMEEYLRLVEQDIRMNSIKSYIRSNTYPEKNTLAVIAGVEVKKQLEVPKFIQEK